MSIMSGILVVLFVIGYAISLNAKKRSQQKLKEQEIKKQREAYNEDLTPEEKAEVDKILAYTGKPHMFDVTDAELRNYIIESVADDFDIPDWNIWDRSIHYADGQYKRMERAFKYDTDMISILCYDPKMRRAKISGKTDVYVTGPFGCSCPDFRDRKLPCKHMYYLAAELDGNPEQAIIDDEHPPLYGIRAFTTGRFSKYGNTNGIIKMILEYGGLWTNDIKTADVVIVGTNPSQEKMSIAQTDGLLQVSPEDIPRMFVIA